MHRTSRSVLAPHLVQWHQLVLLYISFLLMLQVMRFQWKDIFFMWFHRNDGIDWFLAMPVVISASQHR
ncbi:hypothetical protein Hanom_Chr04g00297021 [Helianthus anomalus]